MIHTKSHPLVQNKVKAPTPGENCKVYPWRYAIGDYVYAIGEIAAEFGIETRYMITGGELYYGCPHLLLLDREGRTWRVPQIHTMAKMPTALRL